MRPCVYLHGPCFFPPDLAAALAVGGLAAAPASAAVAAPVPAAAARSPAAGPTASPCPTTP